MSTHPFAPTTCSGTRLRLAQACKWNLWPAAVTPPLRVGGCGRKSRISSGSHVECSDDASQPDCAGLCAPTTSEVSSYVTWVGLGLYSSNLLCEGEGHQTK